MSLPSILFIDDDMIERMKFDRSVTTLGFKNKILEATNGEEALKMLENQDSLPNLIILDLNMPRISGIEFLKILKKHDTLKFIPTIVLTTSSNHKDMLECYKIGIAGYMLKPLKYEDYMERISKIISYWNTNELITL